MATDAAGKNRGGRPTDYRAKYADQAFQLCLLGATDKEMAEFFEVSEQTLNSWKKKHPKFLESLKAGKEQANSDVAKSLYRRALGYSHPDVDIRTVGQKIVQTPIIKHYPPDTTACIFFLKNRAPDRWRDAVKVEHGGKVEVEHSTADDLRSELARRGVTNPILTGRDN